MRIAVLGAGGTGALAGAFLKKGGADVTLVDPNKAHMDKIREEGLLMDRFVAGITKRGEEEQEIVKGMKTMYPAEGEPFPVVIVLTKNMFTKVAIEQAQSLFGPDTVVITFQNGLGVKDMLLEFFPPERVGYGIMHLSGHLEDPGHIWAKIHPPEKISIHMTSCVKNGPYDAVFKEVADILCKGGFGTAYGPDEDIAIWRKLFVNCSINLPCAITRLQVGEMCTVDEGVEIQRQIIREIVQVANAEGMDFDFEQEWESYKSKQLPAVWYQHPSAALDAMHRRQTEVNWLNGAIADHAKMHGFEAPVNETVAMLMRIIQANYDKQFQ